MEEILQEKPTTEIPTRFVGPKLGKVQSSLVSFRHYFPNQSTSSQVQPVYEFNASYGRYGGVSTDPGQKSFNGSMSRNTILNPVMKVLENGLPVTQSTLKNIEAVAKSAKEIGDEKMYQITFEPILIYLLSYFNDFNNPMVPALTKLQEGVRLFYPVVLQEFILENCIQMFDKVAARSGERFNIQRMEETQH